ncbi:MAG TPA: hypothetical protein VIW67_24730 [Terriglobales bacterium]
MKTCIIYIMTNDAIFSQRYRVVAVDERNLVLKGIHSGEVVTIVSADPTTPFTQEEYPLGKLIALSDPSSQGVAN